MNNSYFINYYIHELDLYRIGLVHPTQGTDYMICKGFVVERIGCFHSALQSLPKHMVNSMAPQINILLLNWYRYLIAKCLRRILTCSAMFVFKLPLIILIVRTKNLPLLYIRDITLIRDVKKKQFGTLKSGSPSLKLLPVSPVPYCSFPYQCQLLGEFCLHHNSRTTITALYFLFSCMPKVISFWDVFHAV